MAIFGRCDWRPHPERQRLVDLDQCRRLCHGGGRDDVAGGVSHRLSGGVGNVLAIARALSGGVDHDVVAQYGGGYFRGGFGVCAYDGLGGVNICDHILAQSLVFSEIGLYHH